MIQTLSDEQIVASVNVPTGYHGERRTKHMQKIANFVETSRHSIMTNSAYDAAIYHNVARPGYNFRFWFDDSSAATAFAQEVDGLLESPAVLPRRR